MPMGESERVTQVKGRRRLSCVDVLSLSAGLEWQDRVRCIDGGGQAALEK